MKAIIAVLCLLIGPVMATPPAADQRTERILRKADEVLLLAQVVSTRAVGYGGECPEANWALSVICASHKDPIGHLIEISEECHPAGFFMCLLGIKSLDEKRYAAALDRYRKEVLDAKWTIEVAVGCISQKKSGAEFLKEMESWGKDQVLCTGIPELWDTIRVEPFGDALEKSANQPLQGTEGKVPSASTEPVALRPYQSFGKK